MGQRLSALLEWIEELRASFEVDIDDGWELQPVSGDASFRRYFRVSSNGNSWIAVDAPPEHENSKAFVEIADAWRKQGVHVPKVISVDLMQGFMLLSDFGDRLYLPALVDGGAEKLYRCAIDELFKIQQCEKGSLPHYDKAMLQREMSLFCEWFLEGLLEVDLTPLDRGGLRSSFESLERSALEQPLVCVHRDFHSRNLMITSVDAPGVIDFQDAVKGPITYDLVSLFRDCYISWPDDDVYKWVEQFRLGLISKGLLSDDVSTASFERWFDLMGMQRHLKAIGIFARLSIRDDKHGYLQDIPRTLKYIVGVCGKYSELNSFKELIDLKIAPAMRSERRFDDAPL
ncbi:aminoglycoside phosphotransferase family protein [Neptunomonas japonica]|uniref:aminoglycoside phosphotransferase family protein n=1 Tax=Neptunomonas japonica TaxID=417574 RepID=UPI000407BFAB|nr:phosphotransferase [Neptunomonas japonica]